MSRPKDDKYIFSRRAFLNGMRWSPLLFVPSPLAALPVHELLHSRTAAPFFLSDLRLTPQYPTKSPLEDVLQNVVPGRDEFLTEKYAAEIALPLQQWSRALRHSAPATAVLAGLLDAAVEFNSLIPAHEKVVRSAQYGVQVLQRQFGPEIRGNREGCVQNVAAYFAELASAETAEFQIVSISEVAGTELVVEADIRYDIVGTRRDRSREERIGTWRTRWSRKPDNAWRITQWLATTETVSRARGPIFVDVSRHAFGNADSYRSQMLHGVDYWRTLLDGACGIDVYGNCGLAVGDFNNDGFDDLYVCQPGGLPNRLYRNRGDGSFEDVTQGSGLEVLDNTASAIFADFENKGLQDLLVVCASGPLLFLNQGDGKFSLKRDAFNFVHPPQGTFTHVAVADYDGDGRLDIYFCLYSYYLGLDQYHYPAPYFDARNGPPNFLFHNEGNGAFQDRTEASGLSAENNRYSFACAWGDFNSNGLPDLYVANDFGRNNLYRNDGNGRFTEVSKESGAEDVGAGMSACWFDFDNDGNQDLYAANMWSAAGIRVAEQNNFHPADPPEIRALYRQHARGNSLYRNLGDGKFKNVSSGTGVEMGRWAWCSDAWDFDHDGYADLYIANGYITGAESQDLSSFFWRQLVARSPQSAMPSLPYERGWNAINELIRSDSSWSGDERNVLYVNNHDGTFSEASGVAGLDLPDDSRSFALADLDHDGRLEAVLKNRTAPQLRVLRNVMNEIGSSISFRLRGTKSNRDAIGAAVTIEVAGNKQTKFLQAGSGFLAQHTKELFFGLGSATQAVTATVRWPSGLKQSFGGLPVNRRIELEEGSSEYSSKPYEAPHFPKSQSGSPTREELPDRVETWLVEQLIAPDFSLPDLAGRMTELRTLQGQPLLLVFCSINSPASIEQLRVLQKLHASGVRIVGISVDGGGDSDSVKDVVAKAGLSFSILLATPEVTGIYNIVYRYLFDRRRDLGVPATFLIDQSGFIVKLYQGLVDAQRMASDAHSLPTNAAERLQKALPFPGTLYQGNFQRNDFTYGVAFFQRGYLDAAAASFKQVIAAKPHDAEAYYNLGTLELRRNNYAEARGYLDQTLKLRPDYPEAWNNLGMLSAQQGNAEEAIRSFQQSLSLRPSYTVAMLNLGNLYRRQGDSADAQKLLGRALEIAPDDPEANYSTGMLYARQDPAKASPYLEKAIRLKPDYADALNNLGVLLVRQERYPEAEQKFKDCIRVAPAYDQGYMNLARLYVMLKDEAKAREVLSELLRLQPQNKMAQQALDLLH